jgi:hypothetical protein
MHYKNGRPAQNGDKIITLGQGGTPIVGILYDAQPGNDYCNGRLAPIAPHDGTPCLNQCLRLDDALEALKSVPEVAATPEISPQEVRDLLEREGERA